MTKISRTTQNQVYTETHILFNPHLREFGFPTTVISAQGCGCVGGFLAVGGPLLRKKRGPNAGTFFAQTLCFPRFMASPPLLFAFGADYAQNLLPTAVWGPLVSQTTVFVTYLGPRRAQAKINTVL